MGEEREGVPTNYGFFARLGLIFWCSILSLYYLIHSHLFSSDRSLE